MTRLAAELREQNADLHRRLEEAKRLHAHAVDVAESLLRMANEREVPDEIKEVVERIDQLTARQRQVFDKILVGQANKVIAFELGVSQKTVETHRARIMRKLGAGSLAELVRIAMRGLGADLHSPRLH